MSHRSILRPLSTVTSSKNTIRRAPTISIKSYDQLPIDESYLPAELRLLLSGGPAHLHDHCDALHRKLGPIFREKLGSHELVFIADTKMIQTVIANEGQTPHHNIPEAWSLYNQVRRIDRGLFFQMGEPWLRLRRVLNKVMLADVTRIRKFADGLVAVNNDLFESWRKQATRGVVDDELLIPDVKFELCKWSIEATGLCLFGERLGCFVVDSLDRRAEQLVINVATMFEETSKLQIIPARLAHKFNLKPWRRFAQASDTMIELATAYAEEFINRSRHPESNESLVKDIMNFDSLTNDEISRSMVDLIIAAADTTSNSLQWMLYMLARHPETQIRIYQEVSELKGDWSQIQLHSPYLSGFIKEVSRLYPTAPFLARTLDHEIVLDNYAIPGGRPIVFSLYTTGRMEAYFTDANKFKPERWIRGDRGSIDSLEPDRQQNHAYATLPFGIGARMCIGRRLADLQMYLLIASIVTAFNVRLANPEDEITIKLKMILGPDRPISLVMRPKEMTP